MAARSGAPLIAGGVSSTLRLPRLVEAWLPATSRAVPAAVWAAPWLRVWAAGQLAIPDRVSPQVKPTVTSSRYQPCALAGRSGAALIVGGVLSRLIVTLTLALLPALSTAVPVATSPAASIDTVCGLEQLAMPEVASPQVKVTFTSWFSQPAPLGSSSNE